MQISNKLEELNMAQNICVGRGALVALGTTSQN